MGDMAERDEAMFGWPDIDDDLEFEEQPVRPKPTRVETKPAPAAPKPLDLKSLTGDPELLIASLAELEDGEYDCDGDWEIAMHFLVPAFLENRPNDLVRILLERACKWASESSVKSPAHGFQILLDQFELGCRSVREVCGPDISPMGKTGEDMRCDDSSWKAPVSAS